MQTKKVIKVLIAFALCHLDDNGCPCVRCPASANDSAGCDNEYTSKERLREAVGIVDFMNN
ncbi:hypothetical protein [Lacrimispora sp. 38-1]|uniref:hypothetical protein n=1 Tax=Lacrimispora sp. 38-1 TaxID=3125778 RepID=UPI003CF660FC